jgi:hypothetical protein
MFSKMFSFMFSESLFTNFFSREPVNATEEKEAWEGVGNGNRCERGK